MDKEEPNFNIWGAAKVEQIYQKKTRKTLLRAVGEGRLATTSCQCRSEKHSEKHEVSDKTIQGNITTQKLSTFLLYKKYLIAVSSINKVMEY